MNGFARLAAALAVVAGLGAQGRQGFLGSFSDPAIAYDAGRLTDAATRLEEQLAHGSVRLAFDPSRGYLPAVLRALSVPAESQVVVFSQTSLQGPRISAKHPRALYFNDRVAVGWVPDAELLEIASHDPVRGAVFFTIEQKQTSAPHLVRQRECLRCHVSWDTLGIPGFVVLSTGPEDAAGYATGGPVDHRDPIGSRWGGWYVTGPRIPPSMGVAITAPPWLPAKFDAATFLSPHSDVVALMVLEHQARAMNLITWLGWEARTGASDARLAAIVRDFVAYFTFANEAPLPQPIEGASGFAARFQAAGVRDSNGRSLRDLELVHRLMKYRCSYMIDSAAFDAMPARAKQAVAARMTTELRERDPAALEILRETKPDLFK